MTETRPAGPLPTWFAEPSFAARLAAAMVDAVLLIAFGVVIGMLVVDGDPPEYLLPAIAALYTVGAVTLTGATVGKRLLGLRVVHLATGGLPSPGAATVRWLVPAVPGLVGLLTPQLLPLPPSAEWTLTLVSLLVYAGVLAPPLHRGLHDHAARTVVTAVRPLGFGD